MPSPFPGMDPYLEDPAFWPDFHVRFINYWCEILADHLPDNYEARIEERINLVELQADAARLIRPDLAISRTPSSPAPSPTPGATLTLEPVTIPLGVLEEVREPRIEILHRPGRTLVTVIELLSPSNKTGLGRSDYLAKRIAVLRQPVHLVELDLLIGGDRVPMGRPLPPGDYYALVARSDRRPDCEVYAWTVRHPLPPIPIPLKAPDPDVRLDLGTVFSITYDRGRYARSIDYRVPPSVPLAPDELRWAAERATMA